MSGRQPTRGRILARLAVTLALLASLAWWLDLTQVAMRLGQIRLSWVLAALALSVLQVAGAAWRWSYTAGRLGLVLPFRHALREYYLATFLNQVLPGGLAGDVSRAWRHAQTVATGPAVRAVVLERAVGHVVMVGLTVASGILLLMRSGHADRPSATLVVAIAVTAGVAVMLWVRAGGRGGAWSRSWPWPLPGWRWLSWVRALGRDARVAVFSSETFVPQIVSSLGIALSFLITYVFAARAVGIETSLVVLLPLVPPVLMSMVIPFTVAGWGVREGTAGLLWSAAGLSASDGVALSVTYGVLVFLSTLPGAVILARLAGQVKVKQDVVTEPKMAAGWPQGVVERRDRVE